MSSLQKLAAKNATNAEEEQNKIDVKTLLSEKSLDAAAAQLSAIRRGETDENGPIPITNAYYASQKAIYTPSAPTPGRSSSSGGRSYNSRGGRGRGRGGRGRGRGGRGRGRGRYYQGRSDHYSNSYYSSGNPTNTSNSITIGADARTGRAMPEEDYLPHYPRRKYCPVKAAAIQQAKDLQDAEERPYETMEGPFFSIDVECVAVGYGHTTGKKDRSPGRVGMVDDKGNTILDEIVKLDDEVVVSYLTPLTGLTADMCQKESNKSLEEIVAMVREKLPENGVLVGQSILHDIEWLGLEQGKDFRDYIDISVIFRQRVPKSLSRIKSPETPQDPPAETGEIDSENEEVDDEDYFDDSKSSADAAAPEEKSADAEFPTKYRIFSLRHTCLYLLGVDIQTTYHDPTIDAKYSIELFNKYRAQEIGAIRAARDTLHRAPVTPSFAYMCPVIDGVCLSRNSYQIKDAGRFIWSWWTKLHGGVHSIPIKSKKK